ncbi:MAG: AAA family ATPase [Clostridia bacterium]|nr:AAA family ATPase [Clostridia bacterium]
MFIGREEELKIIKEMAQKSGKSLLLYGKRKVGKTTLLKKALKGSKNITVYYECVKSTLKDNISNFVDRLLDKKVIPVKLLFNSMQEVFAYLNTLSMDLNIIIDEYPYLKAFTPSEEIDSIFQNIIDNNIKNINLFISGSHIGMMKSLLTEGNALYGRFDKIINLKELNYIETARFYKEKTIYDKVGFYSVFGGSPFVNSCLDENKTLKENIIETILNPASAVSNYAEHLLMSDLSNNINAERILFAIANGKKKHKDIEQKLDMESNGLLSKHLKTLTEMEILSKVYPINYKEDRKKVYYEINDNLLRFYYTFVYKNKSALQMLGAESFYDEYIEPSIITFISHRFEEIGRTYFSILAKKGKLKGVLDIGTYYYDDSVNKQNGEFDIVLKRKDVYDIYETKYYVGALSEKEMLDEEKQIQRIKGLSIGNIGFVTVSGKETKLDRFSYVDGKDLYE